MKVLLVVFAAFILPHLSPAQSASNASSPSASSSFPAAGTIKVTGEVLKPLTLSAADLAAMPRTDATAKDKQGMPHTFSGVALADIFKAAGVTTGRQLRGENLAKYVLISCADGYQVLFSLAELDSSFTDRVVILADQMEGKPLPAGVGPFRIVVPGEKKPARNCFQVTAIAIKFGKE
jgi:DMSO/TMAO reductase YedYZ molybdopterin-dependent catalytic subunit